MSIGKSELEKQLKTWLQPELYEDYCPNGLQIEGKEQIKKIAFAVSATRESVEKAVKANADCLIVHHGLFWKFHGTRPLTGAFYHRVAPLLKHDISLFGFHLPLDAHLEFGNAKALADLLELQNISPFGLYKKTYIGVKGEFKTALSAHELSQILKAKLNRDVLVAIPNEQKPIRHIGIITGGARDEWQLSLQEGLDAYLTGEMSEHHYHESRESGITMFAAGHHATEKFGIQRLKEKIESHFKDVETIFFDSDNPA